MSWCAENGVPHSELLEWPKSDRDKLTAWLLEKSARCSSCNTADWEWKENRFAYQAEPRHCQGCMHLEAAREDDTQLPPGTSIVLVPNK